MMNSIFYEFINLESQKKGRLGNQTAYLTYAILLIYSDSADSFVLQARVGSAMRASSSYRVLN